MTSIDLIAVNYKTYPLIQRFIDSYEKYKPAVDSRLIIIDNESDPESVESLNRHSALIFSSAANHGYSGACNAGAARGDSEYLAFFNSDTEFVNNTCVDLCVQYLEEHPDTAVVGPLQYSSDRKVTHGGIVGSLDAPKHRGWLSPNIDRYRDVLPEVVTVAGSAYFIRRSIWNEMRECPVYMEMFPTATGAFPPFPHYFEETLFSYHVQGHGYKCAYLGEAEMIHQWHKSSPVGSQDKNFRYGQKLFREFCDMHGIPHD